MNSFIEYLKKLSQQKSDGQSAPSSLLGAGVNYGTAFNPAAQWLPPTSLLGGNGEQDKSAPASYSTGSIPGIPGVQQQTLTPTAKPGLLGGKGGGIGGIV